jgi:putative spermidine/putrescine transport system substrate-binding protein
VTLTAAEQRGLPYGEQVNALKSVDWDVINPARQRWNQRWTREIER